MACHRGTSAGSQRRVVLDFHPSPTRCWSIFSGNAFVLHDSEPIPTAEMLRFSVTVTVTARCSQPQVPILGQQGLYALLCGGHHLLACIASLVPRWLCRKVKFDAAREREIEQAEFSYPRKILPVGRPKPPRAWAIRIEKAAPMEVVYWCLRGVLVLAGKSRRGT